MALLTRSAVRALIRQALREDLGSGDLTSRSLLSPRQRVRAVVLAKQPGVVAGAQVAAWVFQALDRRTRCVIVRRDGQTVRAGQPIVRLEGPARSILSAERTALNILGHLSGIATLTRQFVARAPRVAVLDTRKTLPGLRRLEKYAVRMGGGTNHRMRLDDAVLIKTNHLRAYSGQRRADRNTIAQAIRAATRQAKGKFVEIEVRDLREFSAALASKPDAILLDNWTVRNIRTAVLLRNSLLSATRSTLSAKPRLEVSGGVTLQNICAIAATGVDRISIGRLTHSAPSLDVSLRVL